MFRKLTHIILIALFSLGTSGLTVFTHYCHGNLVSVSFKQQKSCCGSECGQCKNEHVTFQIKDDFKSLVIEHKHYSVEKTFLFVCLVPELSNNFSFFLKSIELQNSPPGVHSPTLPQLQVFRC
jgi:hypothetical protein